MPSVIRRQLLHFADAVAARPADLTAAELSAIGDEWAARTPASAPVFLGHDGPDDADRGVFGYVMNPSEHHYQGGRVDLYGDLLVTDSAAAEIKAGKLRWLSCEIDPPRLLGVCLLPPTQRSALGIRLGQPEPVPEGEPATFAELDPEAAGPVLIQNDVPVLNARWWAASEPRRPKAST